MRQRRRKRILIAFSLLTAATLLLLGLNIGIGSVKIPAKDIWMLMQGKEIANGRIVMDIRLPRTFAALILGGALALSGYLLQTFFRNPIAGPFVLGISQFSDDLLCKYLYNTS